MADQMQAQHAQGAAGAAAQGGMPMGVDAQGPPGIKFFVGGLTPDTNEEQIREYFVRWGAVLDVRLIKDHTTNVSRGYAFVTMDENVNKQDIFAATHYINNKEIGVGPDRRSQEALKLFVHGLPPSVHEDTLKAHFSKFGNVQHVLIPTSVKSQTEAMRRYAFVVMSSESEVHAALNVEQHLLDEMLVTVRKSEKKQRQQQGFGFGKGKGKGGDMYGKGFGGGYGYQDPNMGGMAYGGMGMGAPGGFPQMGYGPGGYPPQAAPGGYGGPQGVPAGPGGYYGSQSGGFEQGYGGKGRGGRF